jgi:transposase
VTSYSPSWYPYVSVGGWREKEKRKRERERERERDRERENDAITYKLAERDEKINFEVTHV